jgi:hypothetical protein
VKLVYAIAIIHNLKATHHVARDACSLFISYLLTDWVMISHRLSKFIVVISLSLKSSFNGLHIILSISN